MPSQHEKALRFRALHDAPGAFVIPNVWDGGSAGLMAGLGFAALATSSSAAAATLGKLDGGLTRAEALAHAALIASLTALPVAADLENGFGHAPEAAAETVRLAAASGLVGASIEDASGDARAPLYEFDHAVERITAAVQAARAAPFPFTLTARAENFLHERADLADTIRRLQAFERAGADVLFAPGLPDLEAVRTRVRSAQEAGEFHGGYARPVLFAGRTRRGRREARQPLHDALSRGHDGRARRRHGSTRGSVRLRREPHERRRPWQVLATASRGDHRRALASRARPLA